MNSYIIKYGLLTVAVIVGLVLKSSGINSLSALNFFAVSFVLVLYQYGSKDALGFAAVLSVLFDITAVSQIGTHGLIWLVSLLICKVLAYWVTAISQELDVLFAIALFLVSFGSQAVYDLLYLQSDLLLRPFAIIGNLLLLFVMILIGQYLLNNRNVYKKYTR